MVELVEATTQMSWWLQTNKIPTIDLFPTRKWDEAMKWLGDRWQKQNPGKTYKRAPSDEPPPPKVEPPKAPAAEAPKDNGAKAEPGKAAKETKSSKAVAEPRITSDQEHELSALIRDKGADVAKLLWHFPGVKGLQQLPAKCFEEMAAMLHKMPWARQAGDEPA